MPDPKRRPAGPADLPHILATMAPSSTLPPSLAIPPPGIEPTPAALARWLEHPARGMHVAALDGIPIGALRWQRSTGERTRHKGAVRAAHVLPPFRRQGIAAALLDALAEHLRAQGVERLNLVLPAEPMWLRDALKRRGAEEWGWEPDGLRIGDQPGALAVRASLALSATVARTG